MQSGLKPVDDLEMRALAALALARIFNARGMGLRWALHVSTPMAYSDDLEIQAAFVRGYAEGRAVLAGADVEEPV